MSTQKRTNFGLQGMQRWREKYYVSLVLSGLARPCFLAARFLQEQIRRKVEANILANELRNRISSYQVALSDRTGTSTLYLPLGGATMDCEMTGTLVSDGWQSRKQSRQLELKTSTFDDFEKDHSVKLELVKIDVEDFEASVLRGMQGTIRRDKPFIVCEILPREHGNRKTLQIIESLGYTPYWITPSGYIQVSRLDFDRGTLLDFLLSPVLANREVVDDLEHFGQLRASQVPSLVGDARP